MRLGPLLLEPSRLMKHVFEAQVWRRRGAQRVQDHVREEVGAESIHDAERGIGGVRRVERTAVLLQPLRRASDKLAVSRQIFAMHLAHFCVGGRASVAAIEEEIFDHGRWPEQIQACQKQLGIGGQTLEDRIRQRQPRVAIVPRARRAVRVEQRDKVADEQGHVHRIRAACQREQLRIVERPPRAPRKVLKLRSQVAAGQHGASLVNLEANLV